MVLVDRVQLLDQSLFTGAIVSGLECGHAIQTTAAGVCRPQFLCFRTVFWGIHNPHRPLRSEFGKAFPVFSIKHDKDAIGSGHRQMITVEIRRVHSRSVLVVGPVGCEPPHDHLPAARFFSSASSWRNAAMVAAEGSLRLLFFGRRLVLVV